MTSNTPGKSRQYRIGEYARSMGVTPDFLKHYEEHGLLQVDQRESGYRYFAFDQSPKILECMRLKNYGVTIREMPELLDQLSGPDAARMLDEHVEALKRRVAKDSAVIKEHEAMMAWLAGREENRRRHGPADFIESDWEVREMEPLLYLPHSLTSQFLTDPTVHQLLPLWVDWMPVVKSALSIDISAIDHEKRQLPFRWGLIVRASDARRHDISVNSAVEVVPAGRVFIQHFARPDRPESGAALAERIQAVLDRMHALGLTPRGMLYMVMLMHARLKQPDHERYGFFAVPID